MGSPKALPNFQQIVGVEEYCFNMMSHKKNLHSKNEGAKQNEGAKHRTIYLLLIKL